MIEISKNWIHKKTVIDELKKYYKKSDSFFDCKKFTLSARGHAICGGAIYNIIETLRHQFRLEIEGVAGIAFGGCPLASAVSSYSHNYVSLDAMYISKDLVLIEGPLEQNLIKNIILLEDVVTNGVSIARAITKLNILGFSVPSVVCLVDRLEGGAEAIKQVGSSLIAISTIDDFN